METLLPLLSVASITVLAVLSPGPNFVVITKNALVYSRRAGLYTALGVVAGNAIYVTAGALGITALVAQSEELFSVVRLMGAAYLVYLGVTLLWATRNAADSQAPRQLEIERHQSSPQLSRQRAFRSGLLTMLTNPTAALFYLATFTVILPPDSTLAVKLLAAITILLIALVWHPFLAWFFSNRLFQRFYAKSDKWINVTFSLLLLGLAVRVVAW